MDEDCQKFRSMNKEDFQSFLDGDKPDMDIHMTDCQHCQNVFDEKFSQWEDKLDFTAIDAFATILCEKLRNTSRGRMRADKALSDTTIIKLSIDGINRNDTEEAEYSHRRIITRFWSKLQRFAHVILEDEGMVDNVVGQVFKDLQLNYSKWPKDHKRFYDRLFETTLERALKRKKL